jgi:hypothetical protein
MSRDLSENLSLIALTSLYLKNPISKRQRGRLEISKHEQQGQMQRDRYILLFIIISVLGFLIGMVHVLCFLLRFLD